MKTKEQILDWLNKQPWKGEFYEEVVLSNRPWVFMYNSSLLLYAFNWKSTKSGEAVWSERDDEFRNWYNSNDESKSIMERIKTFEDAIAELGEDNNLVITFKHFEAEGFVAGNEDLISYLKLRIIAAALNEGWTPRFICGENRYYPWFELYTKEKWNDLPEDVKREHGMLLRESMADDTPVGFVRSYSINASSNTDAYIGSRLCFKNDELAMYAGKQFASLWLDFCYIPNTKCKPYFSE